jgi:hypothetical protein
MLSVSIKFIIFSVNALNVVTLNVVAPLERTTKGQSCSIINTHQLRRKKFCKSEP